MGRRRIQGSATSDSAHSPTSVPVSSIAHNPRNPRNDYSDIGELADSIREYGILQPLGVVRYEIYLGRYPEYEAVIGSAHWVVVQGNRRLAAAHQADFDEVPVVVQERLGREDVFDESTLIENVHRTDLPPLREAGLLRELLDKYGSQRKLAGKIKKSQGYISQRLSLLDLVPEFQDALAREEITVRRARNLATYSHEHQQEVLAAGPPYEENTNRAVTEVVTSVEETESANNGDVPTTSGSGGHRLITPSVNGSSPDGEADGQPAAASNDNTVPRTQTATAQRKLPRPSVLARQLTEEYTNEERDELVRLLQS